MKLALLICALPTLNIKAPSVYVPTGLWRIVTENLLNTEFSVTTSIFSFKEATEQTIQNKDQLVQGPCQARIHIDKAGTEKYINIFLEQIRE